MVWLALAALFSLPVPVGVRLPDVRAIFTVDDFPEYLQLAGQSRIVYTRTTVRPDGTIQGCVTELSSGDAKLDAYTCQLILKRAKFAPAMWPDGSSAYGVIRVPISWLVTNGPLPDDALLKATTPDLEITVNKLPKSAHSIVGLSLEVAADENGHVIACEEQPPIKGVPNEHYPELVALACQQAQALRLSPPKDASGKPMRSVQGVSVHFQTGH